MARGKKADKELTPEERLEQALVPVEEQQYPVPENWCWVRLGAVIDILNGYAFKSKQYVETGIRIIRITNVQDGYVEDENPVYYPLEEKEKIQKFMLRENDLLISLTGNVGRVAILPAFMLPAALNQRVGCLRSKYSSIGEEILYYYLQREGFQDYCIKNSKGSAQLNMSTEWLKEQIIPLPPLSEQRRIITHIESLFAKLDEAKEKAQAVVDGFELRKSAILHKAFTGELTEKWRKEHNTDEWHTATLGQYTNSQYGYTASATQEPIGPKFLRITDIQNGAVEWDKVPYCDISKADFEKYSIKSGDIMIARTGATTGKSYLIVDDIKAVFASYLIRLTLKQAGLVALYLYYFMQSPRYWQQITEFSAGIAQPGVNAKKLQKIELSIPSVEEQKQIIFVLDNIFQKEYQAKSAAEAVLSQIDTMKKAILARAFRGELGTNDPAEEWAGEMLKENLLKQPG